MLKKILTLLLVATMLALTSCQVVEVIDHGTTLPPEETTQPQEYSPWGFWHSYSTSGAIELTQGSDKAKLYYLTTGYYEYYEIEEVDCSYDGNSTFTLSLGEESLVFTFDKLANTIKMKNTVYLPQKKAPTKHPEYTYPDYSQWDPSLYVSVGDVDFASIDSLIYEGVPHEIAMNFYGDINKIPLMQDVSRPAQNGDIVNIDYCGKLNGVAFEGGTATDVQLFLWDYYDTGYIPGFAAGIVGHSIGETFDVNVTFPESYHAAALAGKEVVFTMTLNGICDLTLSDEEVAGYTGNDHTTYAEWFDARKVEFAKSLFRDALLKASSAIKLPEESYLYFYQQTIDYYHLIAYYYSIDYETLLFYYGLSETSVMSEALNHATYSLALYVLAKENELAWAEEEFTEKYETCVAEYLTDQENATEEEARKYADGLITQMKHELTEETVLEWAFEQIFHTVTE